jgi:hypothetical protein
MAKGEKDIVVLRDDAGNIYLFDHQALEQRRVPKEKVAALEQALKESEADDEGDLDLSKVVGGVIGTAVLQPAGTSTLSSYRLQYTGGTSVAQILRAL